MEYEVKSRKETYEVTVYRDEDVSVTEMKEYIREAVETWKGQLHPENPLFHLHTPVDVRRKKEPK